MLASSWCGAWGPRGACRAPPGCAHRQAGLQPQSAWCHPLLCVPTLPGSDAALRLRATPPSTQPHCAVTHPPLPRYIYNRIVLENATVRAAAVTALAEFGAKVEELRPRIVALLRRALYDADDEVRLARVPSGAGLLPPSG
jgi:hypothetical protein